MRRKQENISTIQLRDMDFTWKFIRRLEQIPNFSIKERQLIESNFSMRISESDIEELYQQFRTTKSISPHYQKLELIGKYRNITVTIQIELSKFIGEITVSKQNPSLINSIKQIAEQATKPNRRHFGRKKS